MKKLLKEFVDAGREIVAVDCDGAPVEFVERRKCKRVWKDTCYGPKYKCEECGYGVTDSRYNFCPSCGGELY